MDVAVAGGTGVVGRLLLSELSQDAAFRSVVAVARREGPALPKVSWAPFDRPLPPVDAAFCALGTTMKTAGSKEAFRAVDHGLVLGFARAARDAGAREFHLVSAVGASVDARVFYDRVKGEMERDVAALGFEGACAYRPSIFLTEREEFRPGEQIGMALAVAFGAVIPRRYRGIPADVVARAMVTLAKSRPRGWRVVGNEDLWRLASEPRVSS